MTRWIAATAARALVLGVLWVVLAGWDADYALYGVVGVGLATACSLALLPPRGQVRVATWPRRAWHTVVLLAWFAGKSAAGGADVAARALRRPVAVDPAVVRAPVRLPEGHARQLALLMMNLMPGSMVQRVLPGEGEMGAGAEGGAEGVAAPENAVVGPDRAAGPTVELHTLAVSLKPAEQWEQLQRRVGAALGEELAGLEPHAT
ncbi:Na+/H+ antiporter subunit E [Bogoriella caseilytica]|uniref:Multicomponent Na+:H+ antiporter subunit E n=1 Tax=Bogoriella caseilytica TaxID=56055 RepID=A0A3N2BCK2_9MICO|nr:Na+/H+ antiporter subunit E [Bogoriella caseilytica]ROR72976.1 multicomponent Na+:H+ antiporter subunit E [Bogoriella caseilytica]